MGAFMIYERCVYLLPFLYIYINAEWTYSEYFIESDKICTLGFTPRIIQIGKDGKSGAIVEELSYFSTLSGNFSYKCSFKVESNFEMGIFAVIQKMKLRKNATTGECIDYVQFRHSNSFQFGKVDINFHLGQNDKSWSNKHCGNINAMELDFNSLNHANQMKMLPYAFKDPKGKIEVRIYVANETIPSGTELDLKIAFTAYQHCSFDIGTAYKKCGVDTCIWHQYFNDGILNCPFTNCPDEGGCQIFYEAGIRPSASFMTKIMAAAIAGIFTMFIVFFTFLWLTRQCALCWSNSSSNTPNTTQMRPVPTMEYVQPPVQPGTPSMDKDLPPSYESLFPNA